MDARGIAGLLALLSLLAAACTGGDARPEPPRDAPAPAGAAADATTGAWSALPASALSPRSHAHAVWTGQELLLWGGMGRAQPEGLRARALRDGARYDVARDRWTAMPDAPVAGGLAGHGQRALWTGRELLVIGRADGDDPAWEGARFHPLENRWRRLAPPPLRRVHDFDAVWAGDRLVLWATDPRSGALHVVSWRPEDDEWTRLEPPWQGARFGVRGLWTGKELLLWGGRPDSGFETLEGCPVECNKRRAAAHREVLAWDPHTGAWQPLPSIPEALATGRRAHWTGRDVLVEGHPFRQPARWFRWSPDSGASEPLADLPYGTAIGPTAWTGRQLLALRVPPGMPAGDDELALLVHDAATGRWAHRPAPPVAVHDGAAAVWAGDRWIVWGGMRMRDDATGMTVTASAEGAAWDPSAAAPAEPAPAGDFTVRVSATIDGDSPLRVDVYQPGPLPLGGTARWELALATTSDVHLRPADVPAPDGLLRRGEGLLAVFAGRAAGSVDPAHPELGVRVPGGGMVPDGYVLRARPLRLPLTLLAQRPPFAPAEGTYHQDVPLRWWDALPPGEAYPRAPDGEATLRLTYAVRGTTPEGRAGRAGQEAARRALALPSCARETVTLGIGEKAPADPVLTVKADALGWFGQYAYGAPTADYRPDGAAPRRLVAESAVLLNGRPLRECVHPSFRFDAKPGAGADGQPASLVEVDDLRVAVTQRLQDGPAGPELVQRYAVTNTASRPRLAVFARHLTHGNMGAHGGDAEAHGIASAERSGALLRVRSGGTGPVVAVTGALDGREQPDRWGVWPAEGSLSARHDVEPLAENGLPESKAARVARDRDGDGTADEAYQPVLAQQWRTLLGPGRTATFTTVTAFGPAA